MYEQVEKPKKNKSRAVTNSVTQTKNDVAQGYTLTDNRRKITISRNYGVIQRNIDAQLTNVTQVKALTNDVYYVEHQGGGIIIKFKGDLDSDAVADYALRVMGVPAPESKLVSADMLLERLPTENLGDTEQLRQKLNTRKGTEVLVAEMLVSVALGPTADEPSTDTHEQMDNPQFAFNLGKVAAHDTVLGHVDRILGGFNWGNMMGLTEESIQQIDNQVEDNAFLIPIVNLNDMFDSITGGLNDSSLGRTVAKRMGGMYDKVLDISSFEKGFLDGMTRFLQRKEKLMVALSEHESWWPSDILQDNANRLEEHLKTNGKYFAALQKVRMETFLKKEQDEADKQSARDKKQGKSSFFNFFSKKQ
ncbi:MAG: hypothetical protein JKY48_00580 [Flavobacteriales bacterium]|nr:hypothetical protein [Flavobacteriales bacterium]